MNRTIGYITPVRAYFCERGIYMQAASGRVAEALARHYETVYVCARVSRQEPPLPFDLPLDGSHLAFIEQPLWSTTTDSLLHPLAIARAYIQTCRRADALFVRGMCPYTVMLYLCARFFRKPICHWIVGDPVSLLREAPRRNSMSNALALFYALLDRGLTRLGRWSTGGALVCNGSELARAYRSRRTSAIVSSTVRDSEFYDREDTCQGSLIRILFAGFLRPEKGIEYLLTAVSRLNLSKPWQLEIAGPREFAEYCERLDAIAAALGIQERVRWTGYVPNGEPLLARMRAADVFVLPTLSEGTPHVLVEARASGLPCISSAVGGVPSTVTDGHDALLVPPRNPQALARAIERVIADGVLRRTLIRNGLAEARKQTLDRFMDAVLHELHSNAPAFGKVVPQE